MRGWGYAHSWKNHHYFACKKVTTRSGQNLEQRSQATENYTSFLTEVDCPACMVALDKLLAAGTVKVTKTKLQRVMFTGAASKHRYKTMTEHYKALAGK